MQVRGNDLVQQTLANEIAAAKVQSQIQVALARKQMDVQKQSGDAVVALIQQAAQTSPGRGVDLRA
jgi:hypothetical protein